MRSRALRKKADATRTAYADALPPLVTSAAPRPGACPALAEPADAAESADVMDVAEPADFATPADGAPAGSSAPSVDEVRSVVRQAAEEWMKSLGDRAMLAWIAVVIVAVAWDWLAGVRGGDFVALPVALGVVTVALVLLWIWQRGNGGFLSPLRGADGRLSTSYTQGGLWTVLVAFAFAFFAARLAFGSFAETAFAAAAASFVPTYLLLLGGPFAAAALAGLNYGIRADDGSIQKTQAYGSQLRDIVADDSGRASLNDSQFLVFNIVAAATFVVLLARDPSTLPVLPSTLVGLTSLSALAYVTTKAVSNQRPVISSVVVATVGGASMQSFSVGALVDIRGTNFVVPGAAEIEDLSQVRVRFGTVEVGVEGTRPDGKPNPIASSVIAQIPSLAAGTTSVDVKVITAAGVESNPYPLALA